MKKFRLGKPNPKHEQGFGLGFINKTGPFVKNKQNHLKQIDPHNESSDYSYMN